MTLADFLLARYAEDEAAARDRELFYGTTCPECLAVPAHVLADIESKRLIVVGLKDDPWCLDGGYVYKNYVLELLALPFADHPDYDPSWRT